ncbi:hypothetical protein, partial [Escherichia coli]|uniref:hypothetical protein n=1 Tax=Escherichia coli TaxID=562 RepID=UPI0039E075DD
GVEHADAGMGGHGLAPAGGGWEGVSERATCYLLPAAGGGVVVAVAALLGDVVGHELGVMPHAPDEGRTTAR